MQNFEDILFIKSFLETLKTQTAAVKFVISKHLRESQQWLLNLCLAQPG